MRPIESISAARSDEQADNKRYRRDAFSPLGPRGICALYSGRRRRLPSLSTKKYFKTKRPLRPCSGPPQLRHVSSLSLESGPPSACTKWYKASQFGQLNGVEEFVVIRPKFYACPDKTQGHGNEAVSARALHEYEFKQNGSFGGGKWGVAKRAQNCSALCCCWRFEHNFVLCPTTGTANQYWIWLFHLHT